MICVLHGISIGLAIDLSTCADVRICAANARFAVKEVDIGLAADIGTLSRLPRCVGSFSWVKDVCLSARTFDAREALTVGFVSQVHETKSKAVEAGLNMAELLATKSPVAVQGTKELLNHARDHSVDESRFDDFLSHSTQVHVADYCYHTYRLAIYRYLESGHAPVRRRLCSAFIRLAEEKADIRKAVESRPLQYIASENVCAPQLSVQPCMPTCSSIPFE